MTRVETHFGDQKSFIKWSLAWRAPPSVWPCVEATQHQGLWLACSVKPDAEPQQVHDYIKASAWSLRCVDVEPSLSLYLRRRFLFLFLDLISRKSVRTRMRGERAGGDKRGGRSNEEELRRRGVRRRRRRSRDGWLVPCHLGFRNRLSQKATAAGRHTPPRSLSITNLDSPQCSCASI